MRYKNNKSKLHKKKSNSLLVKNTTTNIWKIRTVVPSSKIIVSKRYKNKYKKTKRDYLMEV